MSPKVWLITGSSSGFGRYMTELLLSKGDKVIATLRKPEVLGDLSSQYTLDQLLVLKLDVSKQEDILHAFAEGGQHFGRIDIVSNDAGYGVVGEVEGIPEDRARTLFDVNFWGAVNVSKEAVRFFRDKNKPMGGILLQNSSILCVEGNLLTGFYNASKFALEGISESLAAELDPEWNIKAGSVLIYRISELPEPPLHFPLGEDSREVIRRNSTNMLAVADKFEQWSQGLDAE